MIHLSFFQVAALAITVAYVSVGSVVALRRPRNAIGWLLLAIGCVTGLTLVLETVALLHLPGWPAAAWVQQWSFYLVYPAAFAMLLVLFPDGRPSSTRWTWLGVAIPAAQLPRLGLASLAGGPITGHMSGTALIATNPLAVLPDAFLYSPGGQALVAASWLFPAAGLAAAGVSLSMRWHQANELARRQISWLAVVAIVAAIGFLLHFVTDAWLGTAFPDLGGVAAACLLSVGFPAAIGIAVLRHRLYDVDVLLNRTIVYGALVVVLAGVYVGIVALLNVFLQGRLEAASTVFATALIAILFAPVRERVQSFADTRLFGPRRNAYEALAQVALEVAHDDGERPLLAAVAASIARTLAVPYVLIQTNASSDGSVSSGSFGTRTNDVVTTRLRYRGSEVGSMAVGPVADWAYHRRQARLLADIAGQAAVAAHTVKLAEELQASKSRIVAAREEERRRLRRDLHDSLGPSLAALTLKAGAARMVIESDPRRADVLMQEVERGTQATTGEIRRIAHSLRPPALDELGLAGAIRRAAETSIGAGVEAVLRVPNELPPLPAEIEASVLRIAQEALSNVQKHAHARTCWIELSVGSDLRLAVRDDGIGLGGGRQAGIGLASMSERAAELGGSADIRTGIDGGTEVWVRIPLAMAPQT